MRKPIVLAAVLALAGASEARAQIAVVGLADVGYTLVDPQDWLGNGVFNADKLSYAGSAGLLFGNRYGAGLQVGLEAGLHRVMGFDTRVGGDVVASNATAFRALGYIRFWMGEEKLWFGELGVGAHLFDGFSNPSFSPGLGTVLGEGSVQFPVKIRGSLLFDREGWVFPLVFQTGVQWQIRDR